MKYRCLSPGDIRDIADSYCSLVRTSDIAAHYGLTRVRVWQVLQEAGVDTSKQGGVMVVCQYCDKEFRKHRYRVRKSRYHYCSRDCYYAWLAENSIGKEPWSCGMRIARGVVSRHYRLRQGNVVHHRDGDNHNNALSNLMVFECSGDHVRYHRGFGVKPLFDGALHNR